jgi:maltooligosyltrehalose synthase
MLWFIKAMGFRRIYLSCVLRNPAPKEGEDPRADCGYGPNSWEIDPRLGGVDALVELCRRAQEEGLQVCLDLVHHMNPEGNIWWHGLELRPKFFCWDPTVGPDGVGMSYAGFAHLQAVNVTDPEVATSFYQALIELYRLGLLTGFLRVDFPDGIGDPHAYARWVKQTFPGLPILFEYTRPTGHDLPEGVDGTTGGDTICDFFLACSSQAGLTELLQAGGEYSGCSLTLEDHMLDVARDALSQPWYRCHAERLAQELARLGGPELSVGEVVEGLLSFPERAFPDLARRTLGKTDRELISQARLPEEVRQILGLERSERFNSWIELWWRTVANLRCLAFRIAGGKDGRLPIGHEGGSSDVPAIDGTELNARILDRRARAPGTLVASDSHDTVLSSVPRAWLAALTNYAPEFLARVRSWREMNVGYGDTDFPGPEVEWLVYQLLAVLPTVQVAGRLQPFDLKRVHEFIVRTARERGQRTAWWPPEKVNAAYEQAVHDWLVAIYNNPTFVDSLAEFHNIIRDTAETFALGWILLRLTGQPQFELSSLDGEALLRDPDNRRKKDVAPLEANVRAFQTGTPPTRATAHQWLVWLVNNLVAGRNDMDYTLVTTDSGNLAFRMGEIHVSVPLSTRGLQQLSQHVAPEGADGWSDLLKPLRLLNPAYARLGLYIKEN